MSELPDGWSVATIGSLCRLENGRAFKPSDWTTFGLPIVRIQNLNNSQASFNYFAGEVESRYYLRGAELLFAWSGTPGTSFGAHIWRGGEAVLNQHIFRVDFDSQTLDKRFFRHAINQKLDELIDVAHGGVGLRHVTKGVFESTEVLVPPLNEQKRIADKLDLLIARVDACRERLERVPALIKRFRQGVLDAATSGRLTEEWRDSHHIPQVWKSCNLAGVCSKITDGTHHSPKNYPSGDFAYVTAKNVKPWGLDLSDITYIDTKTHNEIYARCPVEKGDVLYIKDGATTGLACVNTLMEPFSMLSSVALLKPDRQQITGEFLAIALNTPSFKQTALGLMTGSAIRRLVLKQINQMQISIPSLAEQKEITRQVDILFLFADRLEARLQSARNAVERLTPALLDKAFRGELVPQDPSDEPASVLLERLRTARTNMDVSRPKKAKVSRKPMSTQITLASVREAIHHLPDDGFGFDDVRKLLPGDYDTLKDAFFALLSEPEPVIRQIFDKERREMRFLRTVQGG